MSRNEDSRQLGFWMTWSIVVGTMIGSGIFLLPASLARFGPNSIAGWLVSGLGAISLAFAIGLLARAGGNGIQSYIEKAFGPFIAFLATFAFWISSWTALAAVSIAGAGAVGWLVPALGDNRAVALVAIAFLAVFQATNALGARSTGRLAVVTAMLKILPLVAVIAVLAQLELGGGGGGSSLFPLAPTPLNLDNIASASALTLFALLGFENAAAPVDKVRDPQRTIPRAMVGGAAFVAFLYLISSTAILLLLPVEVAAGSSSPFADAIGRGWGEFGAMFAALGIAASAAGYVNANVLVCGELGYSMALRREFPAFFARTRSGKTPLNAQLLGTGLAAALILANMSKSTAELFTFMALLTACATLWLYLASSLAALKQGPKGLTLVVVIAGLAFTIFAFYGSGGEANLWSLALLALGAALYAIMRRTRGSSPAAAANPAAPAGS
ncbi:MAG: amino acid permease [Sphingomonas sp.]|nr:amino acid permease [Sphingomonas sp.]